MTISEQIDQIATALSKAQGELKNIVKDSKNPHFKNDYASLDAITETVRPVFAKHGLAIVQMPSFRDGTCVVANLITHSSGQWIAGESAAPVVKADPQGVGSATTYLRRYATAGIAGLAQTDDDGNAAAGHDPRSRRVQTPAAAVTTPSRPVDATPQPTADEMPPGFVAWVEDMEATADEGLPALKAAWTKSRADLRKHLTTFYPEQWEALKAKAAKVAVTA